MKNISSYSVTIRYLFQVSCPCLPSSTIATSSVGKASPLKLALLLSHSLLPLSTPLCRHLHYRRDGLCYKLTLKNHTLCSLRYKVFLLFLFFPHLLSFLHPRLRSCHHFSTHPFTYLPFYVFPIFFRITFDPVYLLFNSSLRPCRPTRHPHSWP